MSDDTLPDWAEEWLPGSCACGARLCRPACYCGGHVTCSASGHDVSVCPAGLAAQALAQPGGDPDGAR